jgi:septal ring factor EnvC (AmiA/AmiB activator)
MIKALHVFTITTLLLVSHAHAEPAPKQKLKTTLSELSQSRETEEALRKRLNATEREMQNMRERAATLAEKLQQSEQRVSNEEDALAKVNTEYASKRRAFENRKADYAATVVSLLRMRNLPPTAMLSGEEEMQALLRTASVLEKTNSALATKAIALREEMATIKRLQRDVKIREGMTKNEREKLKVEQDNLALELAKRQKLQASLSLDHQRAEDKVASLSRASQSLQDLIAKLEENKKAEEKIAPSPIKTSMREFDGRKGSARAPVSGGILHRFGDPQGANGTYRGMVFKARPGATVVAPYDGEIAFTGPFRDYGNMVLIKHKNGYISLIAGLGKVSARLNQRAIRGEPIGTMPEGKAGEAYVELRGSDAKPIDPSDWFASVVNKSAQL